MRPLGPVFSALVSGVLGASTLAACASATSTTGGADASTDAYAAPPCAETALLEGLTPAQPFDYIELRSETVDSFADAGGPGADAGAPSSVKVVAKKGSLCEKATDRARCLEAYAAIRTRFGAGCLSTWAFCSLESVVVNRGDTFASYHKENLIGPALAPIDSPTEAALAVRLQGYRPLCDGATPRALPGGGYEVRATIQEECLGELRGYVLDVSPTGLVTERSKEVLAPAQGVCGRRPEGLRELAGHAADATAGGYFARCTHLEEASVPAFHTLERELAALGAGARMLAAARRAAKDEVRHTAMMGALAEAFGGARAPVEIAPPGERTLLAIALENAREGCVGETYGAVQAAFQARRSSDPRVRATLAVLAQDEARHAELAWAVDAFLAARLSAGERLEVLRAREEAWRTLAASLAVEPSEELRDVAGLPSAAEAARLVAAAREALARESASAA